METSSPSRNWQFWLYALAFGLALTLRLLRLDAWPLTDEEARWAMQAFELANGLRPDIGPQPGYVLLTSLAFFVLQAGEFTARLVPACLARRWSLRLLLPRPAGRENRPGAGLPAGFDRFPWHCQN